MSDGLARFERIRPVQKQGGQGHSYQARDQQTGELVFVKEVRRNTNLARMRFRREVSAYETVQDVDGLPRLIAANAVDWEEPDVQLFLALEWIEGLSLGVRIGRDGPLDFVDAAECVNAISEALAACHDREVTHRDIKPDNIMLRDGDVARPVLVDFGLSFNRAEPSDVTKIEEIGNRFLRLPEFAAEGAARNPSSDVTFLAGILLYCLTGHAPRGLDDGNGRLPHQRPHQRDALNAAVSGAQLAALNRLFDRSFGMRIDRRIQTARELGRALAEAVDARPINSGDVAAQFKELISDPANARDAELHRLLQSFMMSAQTAGQQLAEASSLGLTQSNWKIAPSGELPYGQIGLSLSPRANSGAAALITLFHFEQRGADTVLVVKDQGDGDEDLWRGSDPYDEKLADEVRGALMRTYIRQLRRTEVPE